MTKHLHRLLALLPIMLLAISCETHDCVSCIAENQNGIIVAQKVECDKSDNYISGFRDGFRQAHEQSGNTVICSRFEAD